VEVGAVLGVIGDGAAAAAPKPAAKESAKAPAKEAPKPSAAEPLAPAVRKLIEENKLDPADIAASGKDGRLTKGDVLAFLEARGKTTIAPVTPTAPAPMPAAPPAAPPAPVAARPTGPREERARDALRKRIAERLERRRTPPPCSPPSTRWTSNVAGAAQPAQGRL
jgi:2-oxoglutarate dehydrogenase E2 component (dihydrolipoamide succinyltransferase)